MRSSRRRLLLTALGAAATAGCLDGSQADGADPAESTPGDETPTPTPTAEPTPDPEDDARSSPESEETPTAAEETLFPGYELTTVTAETPGGDRLGRVEAAVADTPQLRQTGLSETAWLPESHGMLFVFDEVGEWTFIMPEMAFGIDIVFADDDGTITTIHHAPEPAPDEDGSEQRYAGRGQYVLEVTKGWTTKRGVEKEDLLAFELGR